MEFGDKLYAENLKAQCDSALKILEKDNSEIEQVQGDLRNFIMDDDLVSEAYRTLKSQINDYLSLTSAMIAANDMDIGELYTLKAAVGSEDLIGEEIITNMNQARTEENSYNSTAEYYRNLAINEPWWYILETGYEEMANHYYRRAGFAQLRYNSWKKKAEKFDEINTSTKTLFTQSKGMRDVVSKGLVSVANAYQDGTYVIDWNAEWRTGLSLENNKIIQQLKSEFMKEDENGTPVYDWKKIKEWLWKDASAVSELEYLAFVEIMSEMSNEDLEKLYANAQKSVDWQSGGYEVSPIMQMAAEKYLLVAQLEAELTIFDNHSKYEYDETEVTNQLSKAFLISQLMKSLNSGSGMKHTVDILSEEEKGKLTYTANVTVRAVYSEFVDSETSLGYAVAANRNNQVIKINPWGSNKLVQGDLNDCERATFHSLDASVGELVGETGVDHVMGYVFGVIGKKTVEEAGGLLSGSWSVANIAMDIKENYENTVAISGALDIIDTREAIDALGVKAGVISISGPDVNTVEFICPKYDPEELLVRVAAYNESNPGENLKPEDLKVAFANDGEILQNYVDWYYEAEGDEDITEYWDELDVILIEFCEQNPGIIDTNTRNMNSIQLQELIDKKNDPSHVIDIKKMMG